MSEVRIIIRVHGGIVQSVDREAGGNPLDGITAIVRDYDNAEDGTPEQPYSEVEYAL